MITTTLSLSEARAQFSNIARTVETAGGRYIITKNDKPVMKIVPVAGSEIHDAAGSLAKYSNAALIGTEQEAFERAMEDKHASRR